jgi:cell division septum initiation protein DivIVA
MSMEKVENDVRTMLRDEGAEAEILRRAEALAATIVAAADDEAARLVAAARRKVGVVEPARSRGRSAAVAITWMRRVIDVRNRQRARVVQREVREAERYVAALRGAT